MDFGPQRGFLLFTLFSLYCPTRHTGLKIFARIFQIKQVTAAKKVSQELFTSMKNEQTENWATWKCLHWKKYSQHLASRVTTSRDSQVWKLLPDYSAPLTSFTREISPAKRNGLKTSKNDSVVNNFIIFDICQRLQRTTASSQWLPSDFFSMKKCWNFAWTKLSFLWSRRLNEVLSNAIEKVY